MKIYTRRGDDGSTGLYGGGDRVRKDNPRVEAYGLLDELNAVVDATGMVELNWRAVDPNLDPESFRIEPGLSWRRYQHGSGALGDLISVAH